MPVTATARTLSFLGHPALLMPLAVFLSASNEGASPYLLRVAFVTSIFVTVSIFIYSVVQVKAGRWQHVDASVPRERSELNLLIALLLLGVSSLLWWSGQPQVIALGLVACSSLVVAAFLARCWLKASLHVGFAVFAASLAWPEPIATVSLLVLAAAVAWSRIVLKRHTTKEVAVGCLLGTAAGIGFNFIAR